MICPLPLLTTLRLHQLISSLGGEELDYKFYTHLILKFFFNPAFLFCFVLRLFERQSRAVGRAGKRPFWAFLG